MKNLMFLTIAFLGTLLIFSSCSEDSSLTESYKAYNYLKIQAAIYRQRSSQCEQCGESIFSYCPPRADPSWIFDFITIPSDRGPKRKLPRYDEL